MSLEELKIPVNIKSLESKIDVLNDSPNFTGNPTIQGKQIAIEHSSLTPKGYYNGDMDMLMTQGTYLCGSAGGTNKPHPTTWGTVNVYLGGTGSIIQEWLSADNTTKYYRHFNGVNWGAWQQIATTSSTVAGADTVDGLHGHDFMRSTSKGYNTYKNGVTDHSQLSWGHAMLELQTPAGEGTPMLAFHSAGATAVGLYEDGCRLYTTGSDGRQAKRLLDIDDYTVLSNSSGGKFYRSSGNIRESSQAYNVAGSSSSSAIKLYTFTPIYDGTITIRIDYSNTSSGAINIYGLGREFSSYGNSFPLLSTPYSRSYDSIADVPNGSAIAAATQFGSVSLSMGTAGTYTNYSTFVVTKGQKATVVAYGNIQSVQVHICYDVIG